MKHELFFVSRKIFDAKDSELLWSLLGPNFFKIVPAGGITKHFAKLALQLVQKPNVSDHVRELQKIAFDPARSLEENVIALYFAQIFCSSQVILDLTRPAFRPNQSDHNAWSPRPLILDWDPEFLKSLRNLYVGFYTAQDDVYDDALNKLGIFPAKHVLKDHFGDDHQKHVSFALRQFVQTFQKVFEVCVRHKSKLHPDFMILGMYLLCLYQHMDATSTPDREYDVRKIFEGVYLSSRSATV